MFVCVCVCLCVFVCIQIFVLVFVCLCILRVHVGCYDNMKCSGEGGSKKRYTNMQVRVKYILDIFGSMVVWESLKISVVQSLSQIRGLCPW